MIIGEEEEEEEEREEEDAKKSSMPASRHGFSINLNRNQQEHYTTQFGFEEEEINERHNKPKKRK